MSDSNPSSALAQAPEHVKLAVDLIMLLEQNNISPKVAIAALDIVKQDCQNKIQAPQH